MSDVDRMIEEAKSMDEYLREDEEKYSNLTTEELRKLPDEELIMALVTRTADALNALIDPEPEEEQDYEAALKTALDLLNEHQKLFYAVTELESEVNNGGHDQYFSNIESSEKMQKQMATLETVLPAELQSNLRHARSAFQSLSEKEEDEEAEAALERCDEIFREREDEINSILNAYAAALDR